MRSTITIAILMAAVAAAEAQEYSQYKTWADMDKATGAKVPNVVRVSGTTGYTGFWFFGCEQFDATNRYALGMTVSKNRDVTKTDVGEIGYFDLQNGNVSLKEAQALSFQAVGPGPSATWRSFVVPTRTPPYETRKRLALARLDVLIGEGRGR